MAGVKDDQVLQLGPWPAGIDNLHPETAVVATDDGLPAALREAENVDLDERGYPISRGGYVKRHDIAGAHSLWGHPMLSFGLFVAAGKLYALPEGGAPYELAQLQSNRELSYELVNDRIVWSSPAECGTVSLDGEVGEFGVEQPLRQPDVAATNDGGLQAGQYQIAITYRTPSREESGTGPAAVVTVPAGGGIALTNIPQPTSPDVDRIRVYASPCNGDVLYHHRDLPVGTTSVNIDPGRKGGKPLETQLLERMPPGRIVRVLNGRVVVAVDNVLVWSEPLRYGLFRPDDNYIRFASIDMLEPIGDGTDGAGLFISIGKRVMWLAGPDPGAAGQRTAVPYGAVPGTSARIPGSMFGLETPLVIYWLGVDGIACLGLPGGQTVRLRGDQAVAPTASAGATLVREANGLRQLVTTLRDTAPQTLAIRDAASAEVYRNGVCISP